MTRRLAVLLNGQEAGETWQDPSGQLGFAYHESWRTAAGAYPLSFSLPLPRARYGDGPIRAYLEGLLPDNSGILERWGRKFSVSPRNAFALLEHLGEDCPGAVQIVPPDRVAEIRNQAQPAIDWLTTSDVAERLRALRLDQATGRLDQDTGQFSLPGAQAKTALLLEDGRWGVPSGRVPTTHILKPPSGRFPGFAENEHVCLRLAAALGLPVAHSEVMRFDDEVAFVSERYDRKRIAAGQVSRIHQEDCCQALGVSPTIKYENEGGPGIVAMVDLLRSHSTAPDADVTTFIEAVALNWILGGTDAHAKNFSLLVGSESVRLAPLYDLISAFPYPDIAGRKMKLAMKVGGEYQLYRVAGPHWIELAGDVGLDADALVDRIRQLAVAVPDLLSDVLGRAAESGLTHPVLLILQRSVSERVSDCVHRLEN